MHYPRPEVLSTAVAFLPSGPTNFLQMCVLSSINSFLRSTGISRTNQDDLFRSAEISWQESSTQLEVFARVPIADLYAALVSRVQDEATGKKLHSEQRVNFEELERGSSEAELGKRIFRRWSKALHDFTCSSSMDEKDVRDRLINAISGKEGGGVALIAATLVGAFGVSPAVAAVIAALVSRLIIAPAADEVCQAWAKSLQDSMPPTGGGS